MGIVPNPQRSIELIEVAARAMFEVDQGTPWAFESTEALSDYKAMAVAALKAIIKASDSESEPSDAQVEAARMAFEAYRDDEIPATSQRWYREQMRSALRSASRSAAHDGAPTFGSVPLPRPRPASYIERPREWDGA